MSKSVIETVVQYRQMEQMSPSSGVLREVRVQYADMAAGGDGGDQGFEENGETTCRGINYPGEADEFFQEVCDLLGWPR